MIAVIKPGKGGLILSQGKIGNEVRGAGGWAVPMSFTAGVIRSGISRMSGAGPVSKRAAYGYKKVTFWVRRQKKAPVKRGLFVST